MTPIHDDEHQPMTDPAESLRLIQQEQSKLARTLTPDPRLMYWPWGVAWLFGFGALFLRYSPGGHTLVAMPEWLPLAILGLLMIGAGITTGVAGARASRQVNGPSSRQGAMYGWAWSLAFAGLSTVFSQFNDLPGDRAELLWGGGTIALTGALHMAGGAIWNDRNLFILGAWTTVVNVAGVIAGVGWHPLIVAVLGGAGMLVLGFVGWRRRR